MRLTHSHSHQLCPFKMTSRRMERSAHWTKCTTTHSTRTLSLFAFLSEVTELGRSTWDEKQQSSSSKVEVWTCHRRRRQQQWWSQVNHFICCNVPKENNTRGDCVTKNYSSVERNVRKGLRLVNRRSLVLCSVLHHLHKMNEETGDGRPNRKKMCVFIRFLTACLSASRFMCVFLFWSKTLFATPSMLTLCLHSFM